MWQPSLIGRAKSVHRIGELTFARVWDGATGRAFAPRELDPKEALAVLLDGRGAMDRKKTAENKRRRMPLKWLMGDITSMAGRSQGVKIDYVQEFAPCPTRRV